MSVSASSIPAPPALPVLGHVLQLDGDAVVASLGQLAQQYGPIYQFQMPGQLISVVSSRELAAELCDASRFTKYLHGPLRQLRLVAGDALFTAETHEPNWGCAHRILMPAFGSQALASYFEPMMDIAEQMVLRWERLGPEELHDVPDQMTRLTLDTLALCAFRLRLNSFYKEEPHPFIESMTRSLVEAGRRSRRPGVLNEVLWRQRQQFEADRAAMYKVTDEIIARRRAEGGAAPGQGDLLDRMLSGRDPRSGQSMDDTLIRHQLVTFLIAGHETTSGLLSYAIYRLLRHPEVLRRAYQEVDQVLGARRPVFSDLARLGYLEQVLRETLRLHPTAPAFAVKALGPTTLGGRYPVQAEDAFLIHLPQLHRDPHVWADPEDFRPERFAPERRDQIPNHAWMPFGHGQRACIGRPFAMQEAKLVLAMLLQRFALYQDAPYQLHNIETLTMKPADLHVRARLRQEIRWTPAPAPPQARAANEEPQARPSHGTPLLVLFGSNAGGSENFARRLGDEGAARGWSVQVAPLDAFVGKLPAQGAVLVVSASYNGQPPDNAARFYHWVQALEPGALRGVRFLVLGCGHRDWSATYQAVPRHLDEHLARAGAQRLLPRGEVDARDDAFGDFDAWRAQSWGPLHQHFALDEGPQEDGPRLRLEIVTEPAAELASRQGLHRATVLENRELVDMQAPGARSKRHLVLGLPQGLGYQVGDYLAVLPQNDPALVERACRALHLDPEVTLRLRARHSAAGSLLPLDQPVSARYLLAHHVELGAPATRAALRCMARLHPCPPHRARLEQLAQDDALYRGEVLEKRVSALMLLERFPGCPLDLVDFLELSPPMKLRTYSIASAPQEAPGQCALTVSVLDAPAWSGQGRHRGTASGHLARLQPGDEVPVAVRSPRDGFHPPQAPQVPMVMICAGSGVAPFRGFVAQRALQAASGQPVGPSLLFFGCDHPDVDFLYQEQWRAWGEVVEVLPAFSGQPSGPQGARVFVQHQLAAQGERVRSLVEQGAHIYVCGEGQKMAPAVRATLEGILGGAAALEGLRAQGRYVEDVFT